MNRREFIGGVTSGAATASAAFGQARRPPNVLVFFTDQQRWDTIGAYGNPMGITPNMDKFAAEGVRFEYAFTPQPVCAPARSSLQTGKYPSTTGVVRNGLVLKDNETTLPMLYSKRGYDTGYIGKWHLSTGPGNAVPLERRGGYDQFWVASNALEMSSVPTEGTMWDRNGKPVEFKDEYRVDALTDQTVGFLKQKRDKPYFLFVSHLEPHFQNSTNSFIAPKGYADRYRNNFYIPPDLAPFRGDWKSQLPDYYGIIARMDEQFGRVLKEVDDNTIVVLTTDHGCHFRTRNAEYKRSCHDASTRIPLLIRGPGFTGGKTVSQLVSTVDLPATLLEASGIDVPAAMQGKSLMNLVRGNTSGWRDEVYIQMREEALGRAIRTEQWKYCVFDPAASDPPASNLRQPWSEHYEERHLYDLRNDPNEIVNLAGRTDTKDIATELRAKLIARIMENGEPKPTIAPAKWYA